jgi:hypothetical protein
VTALHGADATRQRPAGLAGSLAPVESRMRIAEFLVKRVSVRQCHQVPAR